MRPFTLNDVQESIRDFSKLDVRTSEDGSKKVWTSPAHGRSLELYMDLETVNREQFWSLWNPNGSGDLSMHRDENEAKLAAYRHAVKLVDRMFRQCGADGGLHELVKHLDSRAVDKLLQGAEIPECFEFTPNQRQLKTWEAPGPELDLQWILEGKGTNAWLRKSKSDEKLAEFQLSQIFDLKDVCAEIIAQGLREQATILVAMQHKAMTQHDTLALETGAPTYGVEIDRSHAMTM